MTAKQIWAYFSFGCLISVVAVVSTVAINASLIYLISNWLLELPVTFIQSIGLYLLSNILFKQAVAVKKKD